MRKIFKSLACYALVTGMVVSGFPAAMNMTVNDTKGYVYAAENSEYSYVITRDGNARITEYKGTDAKIMIPAEIDGKKVTEIGGNAFKNNNNLTEIIIPEGVTGIGTQAFYNCTNLEKITLPEGLLSIGLFAFYHNKLTEITIPASVTLIQDSFYNCLELKNVKVAADNKNYKDINGILFNKEGTEIIHYPRGKEEEYYVIPEGITNIKAHVFNNPWLLTGITIPSSVTSIDERFFCMGVKDIKVASDNKNYKDINGILFNKEETEIIRYPAGKTEKYYVIPEGIKSIKAYAFDSCINLTNITIPTSVTSIGMEAFSTTNLTNIIIPNSVTSIDAMAFRSCGNLTEITIPASVTSIGECALGYYYGGTIGEIERLKLDNFTIYGYTGTAAQDYAAANGFKFVELEAKTSDTGASIEFPKDTIENADSIFLAAKQLTKEDEAYKNIVISNKIADSSIKPENVKFTAFDIVLKDSTGNAVQPKGEVTVKLPLPEGYNGSICKVYYVNDKGEFVDMKAEYGGGCMVFKTDHFSTYMVTDTEMKTDAGTLIYGDVNHDGTFDSRDTVMLKKHLAGCTGLDINLSACDVNNDGNTDSRDVVVMMKKLAGLDA